MVQGSCPTNDPGSSPWQQGVAQPHLQPANATSWETHSLFPGEIGSRLVGSDNLESSAYTEPGFFPLSVLPEEVWELYHHLSPHSLVWKWPEEQPGQDLEVHFLQFSFFGSGLCGRLGREGALPCVGVWPFPPPNSTD